MSKGFTLIEILIAMAIMVVLAAGGATISLRASRRKSVETTTDKMISLLRLAKSNSQASKVGTCTTNFQGWQVNINSTSVALQLVCGASTSDTQTFTYPTGVTASPSPTVILFKRLGAGTNLAGDAIIEISGLITKEITVTTKGEIE
ncbi:MAG: type II secretion system protein [bacterium]|nr:type II secretion system protein [bacterium]